MFSNKIILPNNSSSNIKHLLTKDDFSFIQIENLNISGAGTKWYIDQCAKDKINWIMQNCENPNFIYINDTIDKLGYINASQEGVIIQYIHNPYSVICGVRDYSIIQEIKKNQGGSITNDYGFFVCGIMENIRSAYLPNEKQLKRGFDYFFKKQFLSQVNNKIWQLKRNNY